MGDHNYLGDRVIIVLVLSSLTVHSSSSQCSRFVLTPHREALASSWIDAAKSNRLLSPASKVELEMGTFQVL